MITDYQIVEAMAKHGGAFVQALAEAWRRADPVNRQLIKTTWAPYWERYEQIATPKPKFVVGVDWGGDGKDRSVTQVVYHGEPYTGPKKIVVQSGKDRYLARRVDPGDRYGLHFCLTHPTPKDVAEPMIEFYLQDCKAMDYDFMGTREEAQAAGAEPLGWFVSRYYVSTLLDRSRRDGLCLEGGGQYHPSYNIEAEALNEALEGLGFPVSIYKEA